MAEILLVRHAETEWSVARRHTGRTDIPLTEGGRAAARGLAPLAERPLALVLISPLSRAAETAALAGLRGETDPDLVEWDYGAYEGRRTVDIRDELPDWSLWRDGAPEGETAEHVGERVDRLLADLRSGSGDAIVFSHGHLLRVLTARWLGLAPTEGRLFALDPGSLSVLGHERETPVVRLWNAGRLIERPG